MKCVYSCCMPCCIGVYQCGLWSIVKVCLCGNLTTNTHSPQHLKPPPRTSATHTLPQPGEHKPPVQFIVIKISILDFTVVQQGTKHRVFIPSIADNKYTTTNQQNAETSSIDILCITIFVHVLVRKGPSSRNQTKAIQFKPSL